MRRALLLGAAVPAVVAGIVLAILLPGVPSASLSAPHITRVFIPAIKQSCVAHAGLVGSDIGYTFDDVGALHTIDPGDGSITGLPVERLAVLNECLAQYPIEPTLPTPGDAYNRNLLYDYFSGVLKGCIESRVGPVLPDLPSRADFIVRLYVWDPYRVLAPGRTLEELIQLITECPERPPYLT